MSLRPNLLEYKISRTADFPNSSKIDKNVKISTMLMNCARFFLKKDI